MFLLNIIIGPGILYKLYKVTLGSQRLSDDYNVSILDLTNENSLPPDLSVILSKRGSAVSMGIDSIISAIYSTLISQVTNQITSQLSILISDNSFKNRL